MEKYIKVPIFPLTKYLPSEERKKIPAPMTPVSFMYGWNEVLVDRVVECVRGVSRKAGGRGFRFVCKVSWNSGDAWHTKESIVWYDDFLQEWFVEVPQSRAPDNWQEATLLRDVDETV